MDHFSRLNLSWKINKNLWLWAITFNLEKNFISSYLNSELRSGGKYEHNRRVLNFFFYLIKTNEICAMKQCYLSLGGKCSFSITVNILISLLPLQWFWKDNSFKYYLLSKIELIFITLLHNSVLILITVIIYTSNFYMLNCFICIT